MICIEGRKKKVNNTCKNMGNRLERFMFVVAVILVIAMLPQFLIVPYRNYTLVLSHLDDESNRATIDVLQETLDSGPDEELAQPSIDELAPKDSDSLQVSVHSSFLLNGTVLKNSRKRSSPISYMNTLLYEKSPSANPVKPKSISARDKELMHARIQIENAPVLRDVPGNYASLFRNYSTFKRSYELMECVMKVYIYKEGLKPIFHKPHLKGIYASEGWFMKQMLEDRHFVVRDPRKAHLFYFPFSSRRLSRANFPKHRDLTNHLENYVQLISSKYKFWNRSKGADHFLAACHDWAPGFTNNSMRSCIRAICNSNISKGFKMWKDVSLPVTNVPLTEIPVEDPGGFPASQRHVLAFFAGSMHGDLRPILINHWSDKVADMKVFWQLGHDAYIELMKSSKYCICAKGYEVHTPRVMESIYYDCVPVIISDDYVPPMFDIFEWESFAVFVVEEDVPNLREILLSIPEEKYIDMQNRVKMVKHHFLWHRFPVKYDLFHMLLHSIWYKRVFQVEGAVIISGSPGLENPGARLVRKVKDDFRASSLVSYGLENFLDTWYSQEMWNSLKNHPHFGKIISNRLQNEDLNTIAKVLSDSSTGRQQPLWEDLKQCNIPLLLVVGDQDTKFKNIAKEMVQKISPESSPSVAEIPNAGHAAHVENPLTVIHAIRKFLNKVKSSPSS